MTRILTLTLFPTPTPTLVPYPICGRPQDKEQLGSQYKGGAGDGGTGGVCIEPDPNAIGSSIPAHVWRIHGRDYDLSSWVDEHPGGA